MMRMSIFHTALLAALLLTWVSCSPLDPQPSERGEIAISIATGVPLTRAASGNPSDGGGISVDGNANPDLVIAIANADGDFVAWYPATGFWKVEDGENPGDYIDRAMAQGYSSNCATEHTASTNATTSTIFFSGPRRGSYTVFATANTAGLPSDIRTSLSRCGSITDLEALQLSVASGQPDYNSCMPLSAKGALSVNSSGNGQVDLQLLRPVARVSFTFHNQTGDPDIEIHACQVTIGAMNPSRGYLIPRETNDYVTGYDRNLVLTAPEVLVFGTNSSDAATYRKATLPVMQVFPSTAPAQNIGSRYLCSVTFRVTNQGETYAANNVSTYTEYSFTNLPVHDNRSADIPYLRRNQHLQIVTRITKTAVEHDYSFNFEVQDWDEEENFLTFD